MNNTNFRFKKVPWRSFLFQGICLVVFAFTFGSESAFAAVSPTLINGIPSYIFSFTFSTATNVQQIGQPIGNLVEYQVSFQDPTWGKPVFYVDNIGFSFPPVPGGIAPSYIIVPGLYNGSTNVSGYTGQIITDPVQLRVLKNLSYPLTNPDYNLLTTNNQISLNAYHVLGYPSILFINASNSYGVINAEIQNEESSSLLGNATVTLAPFFNQNGAIDTNVFDNYYSTYDSFMSQLYTLTNTGNFGTVIEGNPNAPKTILVWGEPNCPYCNYFYTATKPYVTSGQLQIHWNLLSFINQTSRGKVLAILMGVVPQGSGYPNTPAGAFAYDEDKFAVGQDGGGAIPPILVSQASAAAITESNNADYFYNARLDFDSFVFGTVPTILYEDTNGHYQVQVGPPVDYTIFINSIKSSPPGP